MAHQLGSLQNKITIQKLHLISTLVVMTAIGVESAFTISIFELSLKLETFNDSRFNIDFKPMLKIF